VIAGASLLGGVGAVLALPAAATIQAFISTAIRRHDLIESPFLADAESGPKDDRDGEGDSE
jgi:predicted PurR-regulated permease PerM